MEAGACATKVNIMNVQIASSLLYARISILMRHFQLLIHHLRSRDFVLI